MATHLQGYATPEGTRRFGERHETSGTVAAGHFRTDFQGFHLSSLGMGTYLGEPDAPTDQLVEQAVINSVQSGAINVIDTAINYRLQFAERSIGRALRQLIDKGICTRDEVFISSKNGYITPDAALQEDFSAYFRREYLETGVINPADLVRHMHCMSPSFLENQLERSLANLGLETLDLMYLHNAAESQLSEIPKDQFLKRLEATFSFYESMRQANKIRYYGLATWDCFRADPDHPVYLSLEQVVQIAHSVGGADHGFRYIQLPYNWAMHEPLLFKNQTVQGVAMSLTDAALALEIGVFASVPLLQGQLITRHVPHFPGLSSPAQHCLQFVRSTPGVIAPLVGHKEPRHVADNLQVAQVPPLTRDQFKEQVQLQVV